MNKPDIHLPGAKEAEYTPRFEVRWDDGSSAVFDENGQCLVTYELLTEAKAAIGVKEVSFFYLSAKGFRDPNEVRTIKLNG